jgi:hypothetical protein
MQMDCVEIGGGDEAWVKSRREPLLPRHTALSKRYGGLQRT